MSVITISRQLASLGTEIAQAVAETLHYEYVDKEKIAGALADYGLPALEIERFDEKKPPFWDSLQFQRWKFIHFIQAMIYDFASKGNVVLVGRGGQVLLKDLPGVLHVRVIAPFDVRVRRIMQQGGKDERQAAEILRRNDRDSSGFIRSFFDMDWDDPDFYDLVLNTQKFTVDTGVQMILESIHSLEVKENGKKTGEKLADLALAQKVEAALLDILGTDIRYMKVKAERGTVILKGAVTSDIYKENCLRTAAKIPGVNRVDNQLSVSPYYKYA